LLYALLATARSSLKPRRELALENLALRQQKEHELVKSTKSRREKRIVRGRFADRLPPPGP